MATAPATAPADATAAPPKKKRALPLWLIIAIAVVVLGAGAGGFMLLHGAKAGAHGAHKAPSGPPHYLALKPFVVNFAPGQGVRYLQVSLQVMSRDPKTLALLQQNDPVVRNDLLLLLSNQRYATLETAAGKEKLRAEVLADIRKVVHDAGGHPGNIAAIYFTSFVMQ
jgi:flagellar FliL protein